MFVLLLTKIPTDHFNNLLNNRLNGYLKLSKNHVTFYKRSINGNG